MHKGVFSRAFIYPRADINRNNLSVWWSLVTIQINFPYCALIEMVMTTENPLYSLEGGEIIESEALLLLWVHATNSSPSYAVSSIAYVPVQCF